jgi:RNA:NAD 2'-phosphotransferase (TPT1/KptA family)
MRQQKSLFEPWLREIVKEGNHVMVKVETRHVVVILASRERNEQSIRVPRSKPHISLTQTVPLKYAPWFEVSQP